MSASAPPIEFDGIVKRFGSRTVLDDLTFEVPAGTIVGLLGPNGAGKSTAMRVLLGMHAPTAGSARILGHEPGTAGFRQATRKVGTIIEAPPLYRNATALQNLQIRVAAMGLALNDDAALDVLHRVGLADRAEDKTGSFSLGMRQRVGIALAMVGDPSIVVLDEPTNGLDPEGTVEIRELVRSLPERGATTLLCTHRLAEVEATCDYVVLLQQGRLLMQGTLQEVVAAAGGRGVLVQVAPDDLERTAATLRAMDLGDVTLEDGGLATALTPEDPSIITRALAEHGIWLRGLQVRHATLEEAFLQLTRKTGQEQPA